MVTTEAPNGASSFYFGSVDVHAPETQHTKGLMDSCLPPYLRRKAFLEGAPKKAEVFRQATQERVRTKQKH